MHEIEQNPGSTSRKPRAVVSTMGKKQIANAIIAFGPDART